MTARMIFPVLSLLIVALASPASSAALRTGYYELWNLAELQEHYSKGVAKPVPWVGYWWPYTRNGIANDRYDPEGLSPVEKLDLAFGYRNYVTAWEYYNHGYGRGAADWWGHCNGWATAALMEIEPRGPITVNGVTFGVHDRKALLTEYWMESGSDFIGSRVYNFYDTSSGAFWDITPAQFHLVMTNLVGRQGRSVIADRYTGAEVWNHPVVAYEIKPITPEDDLGWHPNYRNVYRVNVTATMWWVEDEVKAAAVTPPFEWKQNLYFSKRTLRYELWLDGPVKFSSDGKLISSGNIILTSSGVGGRWKNGVSYDAVMNSHPDFVWIPLSYAPSRGYKNPRINDGWIRNNIAVGRVFRAEGEESLPARDSDSSSHPERPDNTSGR